MRITFVFSFFFSRNRGNNTLDTLVSAVERTVFFFLFLFLPLLPFFSFILLVHAEAPRFAPYLLIHDWAVFLPSIIHESLIESVYRYAHTITRDD